MGKRLTENLSSLYIGAANSLKPKQARRKIVAYVESYDDISFWRSDERTGKPSGRKYDSLRRQ